MRAAVYSDKGPAHEVLSVVELPDPEPGPGEVRVRVSVSGVNPTDWKSRTSPAPMVGPVQIPNQDGAGVIDAVGDGVDPVRVGERVWVFHAARERVSGTAATYSVVPADQAVSLPADVSFDQGAGLGIPFITAHGCLFSDGAIAGRTVLIAGGAGAVGHAAIQLALRAGATVITTVSSEAKADIARTAGAMHIVNYRDADAAEQIRAIAPNGVDRIIELALMTNLDLDLAVIAPHGVIVTYATEVAGDPVIPVRSLMSPNITLRFALVYNFTDRQISDAVADISDALAQGQLVAMPDHHFTLDQIAVAHDEVEANAVGKVLVDIG